MAGEGDPQQVIEARGLAVVSDEGALGAAVDAAIAANPDVADKIRAGKVQAAGALIGAVMKATRGTGRRRPGPRAHPGAADLALDVSARQRTSTQSPRDRVLIHRS